jgi:hypothetical protein
MESHESGVWNPIRVYYWHRQLMCKTQKTHKPKKPTNNDNPKKKGFLSLSPLLSQRSFSPHSLDSCHNSWYIILYSLAQHSTAQQRGGWWIHVTNHKQRYVCMYSMLFVCLFTLLFLFVFDW